MDSQPTNVPPHFTLQKGKTKRELSFFSSQQTSLENHRGAINYIRSKPSCATCVSNMHGFPYHNDSVLILLCPFQHFSNKNLRTGKRVIERKCPSYPLGPSHNKTDIFRTKFSYHITLQTSHNRVLIHLHEH